jgi:hypothetical protein
VLAALGADAGSATKTAIARSQTAAGFGGPTIGIVPVGHPSGSSGSAPVTASSSTATSSAGGSTLSTAYVSPTAAEGAPCTQIAPCNSLNHAYHVVQAGGTVVLLAGQYPAQTITRDVGKLGSTTNVTFQAAPAALAVVNGIQLAAVDHVTFLGGSPGNLNSTSSGITLKANPSAMNTGADFTITLCSRYVTVQNIDMHQFAINGSDNVTISGGTVGGYDNTTGDSYVSGPYLGRGSSICAAENPFAITITHVLFHDVTAPSTWHPDCLQFYGTAGTVVSGNTFVRCGTSNVMARPATGIWIGNTIDNLVFQNNAFSPSVVGGKEVDVGANTDSCGNVTFTGNDAGAGNLSPLQCGSYKSLTVTQNHFGVFSKYECQITLARLNVIFASNIFRTNPLCGSNPQLG